LTYVEDGFIRSFGLGADRSAPLSLVFDDQAMHFDRLRPSRLENLLANYDFEGDGGLRQQADQLARLMLDKGLSKYNFSGAVRQVADIAPPGRARILVLGQVEDDLSIRYGADQPISGNELVMLAAQENPTAQILYRPHPESLAFSKPHYSNPALVSDLCQILGPDFSIADCLDSCDRVYTVTSLAGFEAALRGKSVVTLGAPFYAGWGFTEDRLPIGRRSRQLSAEQVLAAAYLLYPRYSGLAANANSADVLSMLQRFAARAV
jgi:capsular polysaccharide export protein